jgi:hypothetical protein
MLAAVRGRLLISVGIPLTPKRPRRLSKGRRQTFRRPDPNSYVPPFQPDPPKGWDKRALMTVSNNGPEPFQLDFPVFSQGDRSDQGKWDHQTLEAGASFSFVVANSIALGDLMDYFRTRYGAEALSFEGGPINGHAVKLR